ncbi:MAG TPA: hypothetical protein PK175_03080 [Syntrophales bacterium]|jgi:hypothetical protein|nr:hypothetical protein [Syntrophales bacterium]HON23185.1 hypothetical protein [Syntrophales bacterium]HOU76531.1 hypothetical protein [Syntrophales bacterium]HPC32446.1 hypothetical protein [Syntrophales bacterium]HQG33839.1 hypothetical protein [Syntrophales bacterium]
MKLAVEPSPEPLVVDVEGLAAFIMKVQKENGEIPWSEGGKTDPWDHVESAMGLSVAGKIAAAERAYAWMAATQLPDGSWWSAVRNGIVEDGTRESNFAAYIAVGVWHHYLITGDTDFLRRLWPTVKAGLNYALGLQAPEGEIYWARNAEGKIDPMALLTGSSSIYMSLKCGLSIADRLGVRAASWHRAWERLGRALADPPSHFNMIKARFSMDWYYPVLCGAMNDRTAKKRIERFWDKFAVPGWGVRCVCDRPWVTMAETSELVLTLTAVEAFEEAERVFSWISDKRYEDGVYWMGVTFPDTVVWPDEKTTWTAAAVLLAYDALRNITPAARLFSHRSWEGGRWCGSERCVAG